MQVILYGFTCITVQEVTIAVFVLMSTLYRDFAITFQPIFLRTGVCVCEDWKEHLRYSSLDKQKYTHGTSLGLIRFSVFINYLPLHVIQTVCEWCKGSEYLSPNHPNTNLSSYYIGNINCSNWRLTFSLPKTFFHHFD